MKSRDTNVTTVKSEMGIYMSLKMKMKLEWNEWNEWYLYH